MNERLHSEMVKKEIIISFISFMQQFSRYAEAASVKVLQACARILIAYEATLLRFYYFSFR